MNSVEQCCKFSVDRFSHLDLQGVTDGGTDGQTDMYQLRVYDTGTFYE